MELLSKFLLLLCLSGPLFKTSRRQAIALFPMVESRLFVAPQSTVGIAANAVPAMAAEEAVQHASDHGSHLRNGQCGGPDFFPAWSPA